MIYDGHTTEFCNAIKAEMLQALDNAAELTRLYDCIIGIVVAVTQGQADSSPDNIILHQSIANGLISMASTLLSRGDVGQADNCMGLAQLFLAYARIGVETCAAAGRDLELYAAMGEAEIAKAAGSIH